MILGWTFDVKMGGLEKQKQAFRNTRVAKYEFSGSCEISRKLIAKEVPKTIEIDQFGASGEIVEILEFLWKKVNFR